MKKTFRKGWRESIFKNEPGEKVISYGDYSDVYAFISYGGLAYGNKIYATYYDIKNGYYLERFFVNLLDAQIWVENGVKNK